MANASMKWNNHITNILQGIEQNGKENRDDEEEMKEQQQEDDDDKLPEIKKRR